MKFCNVFYLLSGNNFLGLVHVKLFNISIESQLQMLHDCKVLDGTKNIFVKLFSRAKTGKGFTHKSV
jgi:hypothetical protein